MKDIIVISDNLKYEKFFSRFKKHGYKVSFHFYHNNFKTLQTKKNLNNAIIFDIENFSYGEPSFFLDSLREKFINSSIFLCTQQKYLELGSLKCLVYFESVISFADSINAICKKIEFAKDKQKNKEIEFPPEMATFAGNSEIIKIIKKKILRFAKLDSPILLLGETGCGKNLVAGIIHSLSLRKNRCFFQKNMALLPPEICETELFGSKRGAFTGSIDKKGLFDASDGGTLFLDEIGMFPCRLQAKLLTAVEDGTFFKVGDVKASKADVRIISATNISLEELKSGDVMRQDFFYRIAKYIIELPPLREHKEDIPDIALQLLDQLKISKILSVEALKKLEDYNWDGNVRELKSTLQRSAQQVRSKYILASDIVFF